MVNQLIILGNGFDRASDLKSGYMDFFNFRFKDSDSTSSFWYYILRSCYNKKLSSDLWSDIEKLISVHLKNIITLDFLRNKIWYNSSMNYEASKQLTDVR
ncbi:AbiH family protein, partial [Streptococcus agalactiae]